MIGAPDIRAGGARGHSPLSGTMAASAGPAGAGGNATSTPVGTGAPGASPIPGPRVVPVLESGAPACAATVRR